MSEEEKKDNTPVTELPAGAPAGPPAQPETPAAAGTENPSAIARIVNTAQSGTEKIKNAVTGADINNNGIPDVDEGGNFLGNNRVGLGALLIGALVGGAMFGWLGALIVGLLAFAAGGLFGDKENSIISPLGNALNLNKKKPEGDGPAAQTELTAEQQAAQAALTQEYAELSKGPAAKINLNGDHATITYRELNSDVVKVTAQVKGTIKDGVFIPEDGIIMDGNSTKQMLKDELENFKSPMPLIGASAEDIRSFEAGMAQGLAGFADYATRGNQLTSNATHVPLESLNQFGRPSTPATGQPQVAGAAHDGP